MLECGGVNTTNKITISTVLSRRENLKWQRRRNDDAACGVWQTDDDDVGRVGGGTTMSVAARSLQYLMECGDKKKFKHNDEKKNPKKSAQLKYNYYYVNDMK